MALKFEIYFVRDIEKDFMLPIETFRSMLEINQDVRLVWGGEYVDFHYEKPTGGEIEGFFYPTWGSTNLLGYSKRSSVIIKEYTLFEFVRLAKSATQFVLLSVVSHEPLSWEISSLFTFIKVRRFEDFPRMVTELKQRGLLITSESMNLLQIDPRKFTLKSEAEEIIPSLGNYIGETYEVDSLGTAFFETLSRDVKELWSSQFKVSSTQQLEN